MGLYDTKKVKEYFEGNANNMNLKLSFLFIFIFLLMASCAVYHPPQLPERLEIVPPSSDVPAEIAALSGIWEGTWGGVANTETIIVVEKIDAQKAEILVSCGGKTPGSFNFDGVVLPGPVIEWKMEKMPPVDDNTLECPCTMTLGMGKDSNTITAYWEYHVYNFKVRADLKRRK